MSWRRELLAVDGSKLDRRAGAAGLLLVIVLGALVVWIGSEVLAALVGVLVVLTTDPPGTRRSWLSTVLPVLVVGAIVTYVGVSVGGQAVAAAMLVGVVGAAGGLHAGRSHEAETRSLVATLWVVVTITLSGTGVSPLAYAVAFAAGGGVGVIIALLRQRKAAGASQAEHHHEQLSEGAAADDAVLTFAVLRGVGLGLAVFIGVTWFSAHAAWVAVTALLVMRPPVQGALRVGLQRSLGTAVGVIVAVLIAGLVGENKAVLLVLLLAAAFLMMAVREANYALFAALVTTFVVYLQRLLGADASESGSDRFVETVIGVVIAFCVLGAARALTTERSSEA